MAWTLPSSKDAALGTPPTTLFDRFVDLEFIASGGMGTVYRAWDTYEEQLVALKTPNHELDPDAFFDLKQEFRAACELRHPNVVRFVQLYATEARPWIVMEFIRGTPLDTWLGVPIRASVGAWTPGVGENEPALRFAPAPLEEDSVERIARVFAEVARGLAALHEAGVTHRDVKPANVLVEPGGRAVIVDFGLAVDRRAREMEHADAGEDLAGSCHYMSPEQAECLPAGPAADMYALGVMLYEALALRRPHEGTLSQVLSAKREPVTAGPGAHRAGVPAELDALVLALLRLQPESRPSPTEVLESLRPWARAGDRTFEASEGEPGLLGRDDDRSRIVEHLRSAFEAGTPTFIDVVGPSGIGKTSLIDAALAELREACPLAVTFSGRCRADETVPFKALDPLVDSLTRWLVRRPSAFREEAVPNHVAELLRVFPVFARVEPFVQRATDCVADRDEIRDRACGALAHILTWIAASREVVLWIDDAQRSDADSLDLLRRIFREGRRPPCALVLSSRSHDAPHALSPKRLELSDSAELLSISVSPLDAESASSLVGRIAGGQDAEVARLTLECGGHPLLLLEAGRAIRSGVRVSGAGIESLLAARVAAFDAPVRALISTVCAAVVPLSRRELVLAGVAEPDVAIDRSLMAQLIRVSDDPTVLRFEPAHDRVREALLGPMGPAELRALNQALARALEAQRPDEHESIATHWSGSSEPRRAIPHLVMAAQRAEAKGAFDRAATIYAAMVAIGGAPEDVRRWRIARADALVDAGRCEEAAEQYLRLADEGPLSERTPLERAAFEQLLVSGHETRGLEVMHRLLSRYGLVVPKQRWRWLLSLGAWRLRIEARTRRGIKAQPRRERSDEISDVLFSASTALAVGDLVLGAWMQTQHFVHGMQSGDSARVARAITNEAAFRGLQSAAAAREGISFIAHAHEIAGVDESAEGAAYRHVMSAAIHWSRGHWRDTIESCDLALHTLVRGCPNRNFVYNLSQSMLYDARLWRGDLPEIRAEIPGIIEDSRRRGDVYGEIVFGMRYIGSLALMDDRPDDALVALAERERYGRDDVFHVMHLVALHLEIDRLLHLGRAEDALERMRRIWPLVRSSGILLSLPHRMKVRDLRARAVLSVAALPETGWLRRRLLLGEVRRLVWLIRREDTGYGAVLADILEIGARRVSGGDLLPGRSLVDRARAADLRLHEGAAAFAAAQDDMSRSEAALALSRRGVANPDALVRVLCPGWVEAGRG